MKAPLIVSALALTLLSSPAWCPEPGHAVANPAQTIEYGTDRPGSDITNFSLPVTSVPQHCQGACLANGNCLAWTFVRTGVQGPAPRCWLKFQTPASRDDICCVSGIK